MKVLTTFSALGLLGVDFHFRTEMLGSGEISQGKLKSLTLKGYGDPSFTTARLWELVSELKAKGLKEVEEVKIDDSYFDHSQYPGRSEEKHLDSRYNAPVGALALDYDVMEVVVNPAASEGKPASVSLAPPLSVIPLVGEVSSKGSKGEVLVRSLGKTPEDLSIEVGGSIPPDSPPQTFLIAQNHPSELVGWRLLQFLRQAGIQAPATFQISKAEAGSKLLCESLSAPLGVILQDINKYSNNFMAEQLTKTLGATFLGAPGTTEKGVTVIQKYLSGQGLPLSGTEIENGSGLSQKTRISAELLLKTLQKAYENPLIQPEFLSSLSVMGLDGTLHRKFHLKEYDGFFRGKTGTINGSTSLSGFVFSKSNPNRAPWLFAFIANGQGKDFGRQVELQRKILELLLSQ